jgi:hypothetical protein
MCQAEPSRSPWQWAMERMARMHCRFFAVSITGPCCALAARDTVGSAVPTATTWPRNFLRNKKKLAFGLAQCFGSGYGFNQVGVSGSGSRRVKI